ncbi:hypothetical protein G6F56_011789 [Rhizopus delemar]|nr:hypothetical protein G6F56_011789 [Rhizopus delemar]
MQQRSSNNAGTTRSVKLEYDSLRFHAKNIHARMVQEQQKKMNNRGRSVRLAPHTLKWSKFDKESKKEYALELEQVARDCGLNLHRCVDKTNARPVASSSRVLPPSLVQMSERDGSVVSSTDSENDQLGDESSSSSPSPSPSPPPSLPPKRQRKGKGKAKEKRKEPESDSDDDEELRQITRRAVKISRQQEEDEERPRAAEDTEVSKKSKNGLVKKRSKK